MFPKSKVPHVGVCLTHTFTGLKRQAEHSQSQVCSSLTALLHTLSFFALRLDAAPRPKGLVGTNSAVRWASRTCRFFKKESGAHGPLLLVFTLILLLDFASVLLFAFIFRRLFIIAFTCLCLF